MDYSETGCVFNGLIPGVRQKARNGGGFHQSSETWQKRGEEGKKKATGGKFCEEKEETKSPDGFARGCLGLKEDGEPRNPKEQSPWELRTMGGMKEEKNQKKGGRERNVSIAGEGAEDRPRPPRKK